MIYDNVLVLYHFLTLLSVTVCFLYVDKSEYRDDRDDSGQMLMSHYGTTG